MNHDETNEPFSDNPQENMRIENEILKLKMNAQFGDAFHMGHVSEDLPPEIENEFLKNILVFENAHKHVKYTKLYDLLGKPPYKNPNELSDKEISKELIRLNKIMEKNNVTLDVLASYEDRTIYTFITQELFQHETETGENEIPGMMNHFIYEEFHPNHKYEINKRAQEFLSDWFLQKFNEYSSELANEFLLPDSRILTKGEVLDKFRNIFDAYTEFIECKYAIGGIEFQLYDETHTGMGHAEGGVKYTAILENGEKVYIEEPFKLYMSMDYDYWQIIYFVFPGFEWE